LLDGLGAEIASRITGDRQTFTVIGLANKVGDSDSLTPLLRLASTLNELT
jgi:hypothetical protein